MGPHLPFAWNRLFQDFLVESGQQSHPQLLKFCQKICLDLWVIIKIMNQKLDTHFCSKPHEFSDVPTKNPHRVHSKKFYLSHSGKKMQNGCSLSHSSTFTWTAPGNDRNLYGFTGVVQVNVLEWLKENATCIHLPEWLKYIFLGVSQIKKNKGKSCAF